MAKYDEREGNSCHIHLSLRGEDGAMVFADDSRAGRTQRLYDHFVAGVLATLRDFTLLYAPNINSYKRFARARSRRPRSPGAATTAPAPCGWSVTAPACGWRTGSPAATSTPTSRWPRCSPAACTASRTSCRSSPSWTATPTRSDKAARAADAARGAATCSPARRVARAAFGDDVVDHYVNMADVELAAFDAAVTDWERVPRLRAAVTHHRH